MVQLLRIVHGVQNTQSMLCPTHTRTIHQTHQHPSNLASSKSPLHTFPHDEFYLVSLLQASQHQWPHLCTAHARLLACTDAKVTCALLRSSPETLTVLLARGLAAAAEHLLCNVLARVVELLQPTQQPQSLDPDSTGALLMSAFAGCSVSLLTQCPASLHSTVLKVRLSYLKHHRSSSR